ncbi:sensor histidine kinase [Paenacidovorax monticola]|uniref:sensor histidine kinase n=1 Tax=Paenacidovorax monticola TaxID=1926868 RepID=UPI001FEC0758|nr:ATP-binding protein [Paenacidovorax monticola]
MAARPGHALHLARHPRAHRLHPHAAGDAARVPGPDPAARTHGARGALRPGFAGIGRELRLPRERQVPRLPLRPPGPHGHPRGGRGRRLGRSARAPGGTHPGTRPGARLLHGRPRAAEPRDRQRVGQRHQVQPRRQHRALCNGLAPQPLGGQRARPGPGIPADLQSRLFEPFQRLHNHSHPSISGAGLGLALVHTVLQRHGGAIELDSAEGQGSEFRLVLPKGQEADAP